MCGIVGAVRSKDVNDVLIEGLLRLEYRGYDSAGVVVVDEDGHLVRVRRKGRVSELQEALRSEHISGHVGLAHTRWATHGTPSESNAHPHVSNGTIALVHNGIIENHEQWRDALQEAGYKFTSETDSEVIAHLIYDKHQHTDSLLSAVQSAIGSVSEELNEGEEEVGLQGAYALGVMSAREPDTLVVCRKGSPLVVGIGDGEYFIASDVTALLSVTRNFIFLEEGDVAEIRPDGVKIYDRFGKKAERPIKESTLTANAVSKKGFDHFMLKEIHEQPHAITETLEGRMAAGRVLDGSFGPDASKIFDTIEHVRIIACGTSYHAGCVAGYWLESIANVSARVELASEYRYRKSVQLPNTLSVFLSQSGETADTLEALREVKRNHPQAKTLAICNTAESSLTREADLVLLTRAGIEIGVASTKAFTTQLSALALLTVSLARRHGLSKKDEAQLVHELQTLPRSIQNVLSLNDEVREVAMKLADKDHVLFLGRGEHAPIAAEGALKLKEISYIHAEAYASGELKHGPLALVDERMPTVAVAPRNGLFEKLLGNLSEVQARNGELFVFADESAHIGEKQRRAIAQMVRLPKDIEVGKFTSAIVHTIPLQLLAYHTARIKGTDIDNPRNLAKSVTVE